MRSLLFGDILPKALRLVVLVALSAYAPISAFAQPQLETIREIKLPVPSSLGKFGSAFLIPGTPAKEMFSIKVAPDQSLLVFDPNVNGEWPLVRVKQWWTQATQSEVLNIPGWTAADLKYLGEMYVDLQITPDGHYAVAFAAAYWDGPLLRPKTYIARQPDTIITIVDLQKWQIVGSTHSVKTANADFRGARILNNNWMALQGFDTKLSSRPYEHVSDRRNLLISIPGLKSGPECISTRLGANYSPTPGTAAAVRRSTVENLSRQNDEACRNVLRVSGAESVKELESLIYKGHGPEPRTLFLQSLGIKDEDELDGDKHPSPVNADEKNDFMHYDHWNQSNDDMYPPSVPFQSASHLWYGLNSWYEEGSEHSDVSIFDAEGRKLKEQSLPHLLCQGQKQRGTCGCHVEDVSEAQHVLLAYCEIMHQPGYVKGLLKQWLAVIRSDDLSEIATVNLSKGRGRNTSEAIAIADGKAYILGVAAGAMLRVYEVPRTS
jgi:hypothetical protein